MAAPIFVQPPSVDPTQRKIQIPQDLSVPGPRDAAALDDPLGITKRLRKIDSALDGLLRSIDVDGKFGGFVGGLAGMPGAQAGDPVLYARSVARLGAALGKGGLAAFGAEQTALFLLNRHGKVWNPATIAPLPILQNFSPAALDVNTGTPRAMTGYDDGSPGPIDSRPGFYEANHGPGGDDIHRDLAAGTYAEIRATHYPPFVEAIVGGGSAGAQNVLRPLAGQGRIIGALSQDQSLVDDPNSGAPRPLVATALAERNINTREAPYADNADFLVKNLVDQALKEGESEGVRQRLKTRFFNPGTSLSPQMEYRPSPGRDRLSVSSDPLVNSAFVDGLVPAKLPGENKFGFSTFRRGAKPKVKDDDAYVPLSFTDLRPVGNVYRTVYFRPFIDHLGESFSPEWNLANYFGRVDPVATYQSTGRAISLVFRLASFSPEDVPLLWKKLGWLTSMLYPSYDKDLAYQSGPVVRMRVGDVISALGPEGARGLPGIITSLELDYDGAPWELRADMKVPRNVSVALSFLVLHDKPLGVGAEGKFGGLGTIDGDGKFLPHSRQKAGGSGDSKDSSPDVDKGATSFRSVGGDAEDMNAYESLGTADGEGN